MIESGTITPELINSTIMDTLMRDHTAEDFTCEFGKTGTSSKTNWGDCEPCGKEAVARLFFDVHCTCGWKPEMLACVEHRDKWKQVMHIPGRCVYCQAVMQLLKIESLRR